MRSNYYILVLSAFTLLISSCGVNSHIMLRGDEEVITEDIPLSPEEAYRIAPDDKITFTMYTEGGRKIVDLMAGIDLEGGNVGMGQGGGIEYLVRPDGMVELPIIGAVKLDGLSVIEGQDKIEELFASKYKNPFVQLSVTNRRVIVFPGTGGSAQVMPIVNDNTTLMEAIASVGGITERGKASEIKVIRKTSSGRKVYLIDLSTLSGLKYTDMVVQSGDYIYVEPTKQLSREVLKEVTPIFSLVSSTFLLISVLLSLN